MLSGDVPPNQTIYLRNLNEKIKKEGTVSSPG
jgi:U2 small nuclear ribonucleoprotein B''